MKKFVLIFVLLGLFGCSAKIYPITSPQKTEETSNTQTILEEKLTDYLYYNGKELMSLKELFGDNISSLRMETLDDGFKIITSSDTKKYKLFRHDQYIRNLVTPEEVKIAKKSINTSQNDTLWHFPRAVISCGTITNPQLFFCDDFLSTNHSPEEYNPFRANYARHVKYWGTLFSHNTWSTHQCFDIDDKLNCFYDGNGEYWLDIPNEISATSFTEIYKDVLNTFNSFSLARSGESNYYLIESGRQNKQLYKLSFTKLDLHNLRNLKVIKATRTGNDEFEHKHKNETLSLLLKSDNATDEFTLTLRENKNGDLQYEFAKILE